MHPDWGKESEDAMKKQPKIKTKMLVVKTNLRAGPQEIQTLEPMIDAEVGVSGTVNVEPLSTTKCFAGW